MKDLLDENLSLAAPSQPRILPVSVPTPRRAPPPAAAALAARQVGASAPDAEALRKAFVAIGEIATPFSSTPRMAPAEEAAAIKAAIAHIRPLIQLDGGDVELAEITPSVVRVKLSGQCAGCLMSGRTLGTLARDITAALGRPIRVLPAMGA